MTRSDGDPLLPLARVEDYLRGRIAAFSSIRSASKTSTGQSNPTFILDTDAGLLVLRRKPPGTLLKSAHAVEREYRVMASLQETAVPVPRMHLLCEDPAVLGTPFFVMAYAAGVTQNDPRCLTLSRDVRTALYDAMNSALAALHRLDPAAIGLSDFGRPSDYFARQLHRWTAQYRASETERIDALETVMDWLAKATPPADGPPALVHGDWRLDNLRFDPDSGAISAVLDWELSTLGHPLADLGAQIMQWRMPVGTLGRGLAGADRAALGIPQDRAYIETYADRVMLTDVPDMTYPLVFAYFRMAAILQGVKKRALDGNASNPAKALEMGRTIPAFASGALAVLNAADAMSP